MQSTKFASWPEMPLYEETYFTTKYDKISSVESALLTIKRLSLKAIKYYGVPNHIS